MTDQKATLADLAALGRQLKDTSRINRVTQSQVRELIRLEMAISDGLDFSEFTRIARGLMR